MNRLASKGVRRHSVILGGDSLPTLRVTADLDDLAEHRLSDIGDEDLNWRGVDRMPAHLQRPDEDADGSTAQKGVRPEDGVDRVVSRRDPNCSGGLLAKLAELLDLGRDLLEARPHSLEEALARLGRRDASGGAGQEADAEPGLEAADGLAQRRTATRRALLRRG